MGLCESMDPMTTARDVTERDTERAAEIVSQFRFAHPVVMLDCVKDSEQWVQVVAAALSERERATVAMCCAAVCFHCRNGYAIEYHDEPLEIKINSKLYSWVHKSRNKDAYFPCDAYAIRVDAARRESEAK